MMDAIRAAALGLVDRLNLAASPFRRFTRAPDVVDRTPLWEKDAMLWNDVRARWLRGPRLEFYWHMEPNDLGDMAIWQGWYLAACAFRGDWTAAALAFDGCERLVHLGGSARLCRGADLHPERGGFYAVDPSRKHYRDGDYAFIDDCSESSLLGVLLGTWAVMAEPGAPGHLRWQAICLVRDLAEQVVKDGYRLLNQDGTPARYGDLRPSMLTAPIRLASLAALLCLAAQGADDGANRWKREYRSLMDAHVGAVTNPETHLLWVHPWYQDLLAYMALLVLVTQDGGLSGKRDDLRHAMTRLWRKNRNEGNSLYCYMVARALGPAALSPEDLRGARQTLEEFNVANPALPTGKQPGKAHEPGQSVVTWGALYKPRMVTLQPIATWRRPPADFIWQRCPYEPRGETHARYNGMDFCAAYWLGVRVGALPAPPSEDYRPHV